MIVGWFVAIYLLGPVLVGAYVKREYASQAWHPQEHWARLGGSALIVPLLWYLVLIYLRATLTTLWAALFVLLATWTHLTPLARLGDTSLFPPTFTNLLFRWLLCLPLAGLLACALEMIHPQTRWEPSQRVLTPEEQVAVTARVAAEERKRSQAANTSPLTNRSVTKPKVRSRTTTRRHREETVAGPVIPKADSLWGAVDWNTVSDTHPAKQAAIEAAQMRTHQQQEASREAARNRWLTQQAASLQPQPPSASRPRRQAVPHLQSTSTAHEQPSDEYDWNDGEGTVEDL
jgi:hypothetical protein